MPDITDEQLAELRERATGHRHADACYVTDYRPCGEHHVCDDGCYGYRLVCPLTARAPDAATRALLAAYEAQRVLLDSPCDGCRQSAEDAYEARTELADLRAKWEASVREVEALRVFEASVMAARSEYRREMRSRTLEAMTFIFVGGVIDACDALDASRTGQGPTP